MKNLTIELLRTLGCPFISKEYQIPRKKEKIQTLYSHAIKNRIPLLYLDILKKQNKLSELEQPYIEGILRCSKIWDAMARLSDFLNELDVEHAIFKSIKPFPDASVDIDTIVFNSKKHQQAAKLLSKSGWELLGYGPQSIDLFDSEAEVGVDLYKEIAISCIVYLDKRKIKEYSTQRVLPNKKKVQTLKIEADLIATIVHSVIKEQMYTLADYYFFLNYLKIIKNDEIENFINLVKINKIEASVKSFVSVTVALTREAYGYVPEKLAVLSSVLGIDGLEESRIARRFFRAPHKYHVITLLKSMKNILKEEKARKSVVTQFLNMTNPSFTKNVIAGFTAHIIRETY